MPQNKIRGNFVWKKQLKTTFLSIYLIIKIKIHRGLIAIIHELQIPLKQLQQVFKNPIRDDPGIKRYDPSIKCVSLKIEVRP